MLVSLALALAARPSVLVVAELPEGMSADERLALLHFLARLSIATSITVLALQEAMSDEETAACSTVRHGQDAALAQPAQVSGQSGLCAIVVITGLTSMIPHAAPGFAHWPALIWRAFCICP